LAEELRLIIKEAGKEVEPKKVNIPALLFISSKSQRKSFLTKNS